MTEAIYILNQCNFFIGIVSSAIIAIGNMQQEKLPVYSEPAKPMIFDTAYAEYTEPEETEEAEEPEETTEPEESEESSESEEYETDDCVYEEDNAEYTESEVYDDYGTQSVFGEGFDSSFKAYMDYRCITDTSSVQYQLQQQAYTDSRGFRRIGDDYCVALGTGFTGGCGERFTIYLDSGYCFNAIVSDVKSDMHTDSTNCYVPRGENAGNVVEFIIDTDYADGSMLSSGNAGYYDDLSGNVTAVVPLY